MQDLQRHLDQLAELDARQDQVLLEIDELNNRLESLLTKLTKRDKQHAACQPQPESRLTMRVA